MKTHSIKRRVGDEVTTLCGKCGFTTDDPLQLRAGTCGVKVALSGQSMPSCKACLKSLGSDAK